VFLDEPTTGFDPAARRAAWDVIAGLRQLGKTIFLTTHYMDEAEYLADRIAVLAGGRIVAAGSPQTPRWTRSHDRLRPPTPTDSVILRRDLIDRSGRDIRPAPTGRTGTSGMARRNPRSGRIRDQRRGCRARPDPSIGLFRSGKGGRHSRGQVCLQGLPHEPRQSEPHRGLTCPFVVGLRGVEPPIS